MSSSFFGAFRALVVLLCLVLPPLAHAADPAVRNEAPRPSEAAPEDPVAAIEHWRRVDRRMQVMSWVGVGFAAAGTATLAAAFATQDPGWLVVAFPLTFLATPMIHIGAVMSGYALSAQDLGVHPYLGWVAIGMVAGAAITGLFAGVTYVVVDLLSEGPTYGPGLGTSAFLTASTVLLYGSCALGLFQLVVNAGNRPGRPVQLGLAPPARGRPGMLLVSGSF